MKGNGGEPHAPEGGRRPPKVGTVILWMVLMGMPFVITSQLLRASLDLASAGDQPGGEIAGHVRGKETGDVLRGVPVVLFAAQDDTAPALKIAETETDAAGSFRFDAPPYKGFYRMHIGGGDLRRVVRSFSFLDGDGPLEVELGSGAILDVALDRGTGSDVRGGTLYLDAQLGEGTFRFFGPTMRMEDRFEGPRVRIDGLPPLKGKLRLELDGGERIEFEFELEEGQTRELAYTI